MADKNFVRSMFNNIAPTYDKLNHILSLNIDKIWRKKAVKRICKRLKDTEIQGHKDLNAHVLDVLLRDMQVIGAAARLHSIRKQMASIISCLTLNM